MTNPVKRYGETIHEAGMGTRTTWGEKPDGEWVKYDDIKHLLQDEPKALHPDTARLNWILRNVSGAEWYRLGIIYEAGMTREDLDKWLALNR